MNPDASIETALIAAAESEQRALGQRLHDTVCQSLSSIAIIVGLLQERLKTGRPVEAAQVEDLSTMVDHALQETRALSRKLHPVQSEPAGLMAALEELAQSAGRAMAVEFRCLHPVLIPDATTALALYRMAEEAVEFAQQRAANRVTISLLLKRGQVTLEVRDDGQSAESAGASEAVAGASMARCRARSANLELTRQASSTRGNKLTCKVPLAVAGA